MQNWKKRVACAAAAVAAMGSLLLMKPITAMAQQSPYTTYIYESTGYAVQTPEAYEFAAEYAGEDLGAGALKGVSHICTDSTGRILVTDSGNDRVLVLDSRFQMLAELTGFNGPQASYVAGDGHIYVADTNNGRIVEFDEDYQKVREIGAPKSEILGSNYSYKPAYVVVDSANRIYVMSSNENRGILELSAEGEFIGFFGAQSVKANILDWFKTMFMTKEQKKRTEKIIPRTYSGMTIDSSDFIWVTSNSIDQDRRLQYMESKESDDAVIKRLNPNGKDVLARNGFWAPGGDLGQLPSSIVGVAVRENGTYTLLDDSHNKLFTYDSDGNLLYAFGGTGAQDGLMTRAAAVAYLGDELLVVDGGDGTIVRYRMTDYGRALDQAIEADRNRDFELSTQYWQAVNDQSQNHDLAYEALGNNYMRNGYYEEAMENYYNANDREGYSRAYKLVRTQYVKEHFLLVIAVPVILLALWLLFRKRVNAANKILYPIGTKHTLKDELFFAFRVIYHPFDGFWDLKRENRGSIRSATVIMAMVLFTFWYKAVGTAYLFREDQDVNIIMALLNVIIPFFLWCIVSWGLTTFLGGEGSMRDIYIMSAYSMVPLILTNIPVTLLSNVVALEEEQFLTFFVQLGYVWMVLLLLLGSMVIHDYRFGKNILNVIFSLAGMAAVMFLALLFVTLGQNIIEFVVGIYEEVVFRL